MTIFTKNQQDLIQYRLQMGKEAFKASEILLEQKMFNAANSILYAAFFHHIAALLAKDGHTPRRVTEAVELFESYLKTNPKDLDKLSYEILADLSKQAIVAPFNEFEAEKTKENYNIAANFFDQIEKLLHKKENLEVEIVHIYTQAHAYLRSSKHTILHKTQQLRQALEAEVLKSPKAKEDFEHFVENPADKRVSDNIVALLQNAFAFISPEVIEQLEQKTSEASSEIAKLPVVKPNSNLNDAGRTVNTVAKKQVKDTDRSPILQPWDFTELSEKALEHSINMAKLLGRPIHLLNIVKKDKEVPDAMKQLKVVCSMISEKHHIEVVPVVKAGNIFTDISTEADERNAEVVIMGTHGMKGMQKITGSWALKVISDTKAPFVVVQDKPARDGYNNIVIPISHLRDMKKVLNEVRFLHEHYQPTFHLVRLEKCVTEQVKKQAIQNFVFIKSYMKHNEIAYTDNEIKDTKSLNDAGLLHAINIKADLLMILTTKDMNTADLIMGAEEQKVIANESKMPVMCINPLHSKYSIATNLSGSF